MTYSRGAATLRMSRHLLRDALAGLRDGGLLARHCIAALPQGGPHVNDGCVDSSSRRSLAAAATCSSNLTLRSIGDKMAL